MPAEPSHANTPLQQHRDERRSRSNSRSRSRNPSRASGVASAEPPPPVPPLGPEWSTETPHRGRRQTPHSRGRSWRPLPASDAVATSSQNYTQLEQELLDCVVQRGAYNDSAKNPSHALQYSPSRPEFVGEEARRLQRESYEWFNSPDIPRERVEPIRLTRPTPTSQLAQQLHAPLPPIMPNDTDDNYPAERFEDTEFVPATLQEVLGTPAADFQRHGPSTAFPDPGHNAPAPVSRRAREAHSTGPGSSRIRPHRSTPEFRTQAGSWASMASGSAKGHERYWEAQSGPGVRTTAAGGEVDPLDRPNYPIPGTGNEYTIPGAPAPELEPRVAGPSGPRIPVTSLMAPPPSLPRTLSSPALTQQGVAPGAVPAGSPTLPPILPHDGSINVTPPQLAGRPESPSPFTSIAGPVAGPSAQATTSGPADGPSAQTAASAPPVGPSGSFACPATAFPRPSDPPSARASDSAGSETPSREREAWEALTLAEVHAQHPQITEAHNAVVNDTLQLAAYKKDKQAKDEKYAQDMETYNRNRAAALEARVWEKKHGVKEPTPLPRLPRRPAHKDPPKVPLLAIDPKPKHEPPTLAPRYFPTSVPSYDFCPAADGEYTPEKLATARRSNMLTYLLGRGLVQDHLRVSCATIVPLALRGPTPEPQGEQGGMEDVTMGDLEATGEQGAETAAMPASEVAETVEEVEVKQEPYSPNQVPVAAQEPAEEDELEEGDIRE